MGAAICIPTVPNGLELSLLLPLDSRDGISLIEIAVTINATYCAHMAGASRHNGVALMNEIERRAYGTQIRAIRSAIGWTREKLASESEVPISTIKGIENGAAGQQENLEKIFGALGVTTSDYGLITHEVRDMLGVFAPLVARVPRDKLAETMSVVMRILSRVGQGLPIPELVIGGGVPTIDAGQVNFTLGDSEVVQTNVSQPTEAAER